MNEDLLSVVRFGLTALQNLGFAVLVGALLSDGWLKRKPSAWQASTSRSLARSFRAAALAAFLASALYFWIHSAVMADTSLWEAWPAVKTMLRATEFGHAWAATAVSMLVVIALSLGPWHARSPRLRIALWLALASAALGRSHSGHPVDSGPFSVPVLVDWAHLLSISAWVGLVCIAACIVMPCIAQASSADRLNGADYVQSLSDAATYGLVGLLLTGGYNGWHLLGVPENLLNAHYGRVLLLKLAFVFAAAALGGHNRLFVMPQLLVALRQPSSRDEGSSIRRFTKVLRVEAAVLFAVLIVAAILVASALPGTE